MHGYICEKALPVSDRANGSLEAMMMQGWWKGRLSATWRVAADESSRVATVWRSHREVESGARLCFEVGEKGEAWRSVAILARLDRQRGCSGTVSAPEFRHKYCGRDEGPDFVVAGVGPRHRVVIIS